MDFIQMVQRLQIIYVDQVVLILCGAFYIAIGEDAIILNELLGLKTTCAKHGICKVGIPKNSMDKYIGDLDENLYGYIVLDYDKNSNEIVKKYEKSGKVKKINDFNKGCGICEFYGKYKITEYEEALNKYFDSIDKKVLLNILKRKIKDEKVLWLVKEILYSQEKEKGLEIRKLHISNFWKYLFK